VLVGTPFVALAKAQADAMEYPDARLVVIPRPIAVDTQDAVRDLGARLAGDVIDTFLR
jgi:hypothetical protein